MRVTLDIRNCAAPLSVPFHGGTEMLMKRLARTLAGAGHQVNVVSNEPREAVAGGAYWWTAAKFPAICDTLIVLDRTDRLREFQYERAIVFATAVEMPTGEGNVDAVACLSRAHGLLLNKHTPSLAAKESLVIPPGVDVPEEQPKVPGRMVWCNSPDRGLIHIARMWPNILKAVPEATIRVTYNVRGYLERTRWMMDERGAQAVEMGRWIEDNPSTVFCEMLPDPADVRTAQAVAELYAYPMDPLNAGVGIHALAAQEAAAAGCALLLSYHEGLPEVFGECADFLELPVNYTDWTHHIADILTNPERRIAMQDKARAWAAKRPWAAWESEWQDLVAGRIPVEATA